MKRSQLNKTSNKIYKLADMLIAQLDEITELMHQEADKADDCYQEKSEKWKEGEKGEEFAERMEVYQDNIVELNDARDEIESLLYNIAGTIESL